MTRIHNPAMHILDKGDSTLMKKVVLRISAAIFGTLLILIFVGFGLVQYLNSEAGSKWALAKVQEVLHESFATELKYESASLSLFSGVHFSNLKIDSKFAGNEIALAMRKIDLEYSIEVFARNLKVKGILIDQPNFQIQFQMPKTAPQKQSIVKEVSPIGAFAKLIRNPILKIEVEKIEVRNLDLDLRLSSGEKQISTTIRNMNFGGGFSLLKKQLKFFGNLEANNANDFSFSDTGVKAAASWLANSKWQIDIDGRNNDWSYKIAPLQMHFSLKNFTALQKLNAQLTDMKMPQLILDSDAQIEVRSAQFLEFEVGDVKVANSSAKLTTGAIQILRQQEESKQYIKIESNEWSIQSELKKDIEVKILAMTRNISHPDIFVAPTHLQTDITSSVRADLKHIETHVQMKLGSVEFANAQMSIDQNLSEGAFSLIGTSKMIIDPRLAQIFKSGAALKKMGSIVVPSEFKVKLAKQNDLTFEAKTQLEKVLLPISKKTFDLQMSMLASLSVDALLGKAASQLKLKNADFGDWVVDSDTQFSITKSSEKLASGKVEINEVNAPKAGLLPGKLLKPIQLKHEFKMSDENLLLNLSGEAPLIEVSKLGTLQDSKFNVKILGDHLSTDKNFEISLKLDQGPFQINPALDAPKISVANVKMELEAKLKQQTYFNLDKFQVAINKDLVQVSAEGSGNLKTKNLQIQLQNHLQFPKDFPEVFGQKIYGEIIVPLNIAIRKAQDISLDGTIQLKNLGVARDDMAIEGLNGWVPFSEHLIFDRDHFRFTELVTQNAFERVNFERLRPLLQSTELISIQKIRWQEKLFGPLTGYFSIRQNMIILHEFSLDLGAGSVYGEMSFDAYPKNLQLGLLSRVTGVDLGQVLPKKFLSQVPAGEKNISARTGFIFSINKAMLNGRIDVTQIGSAQMITMINLLDPQFQDDKLNKMRTLLTIGYPTAVAMNFNQGYLDLDIDLNALGVSSHQALRSIPLTGFLLKPTSEIISASQKGPLK